MQTTIERAVMTQGREENIMQHVVFPYNPDEMREVFETEDLLELCFVDGPDQELGVPVFNDIIREAEERAAKIESSIATAVRFMKKKVKKNPELLTLTEEIPLNYQDSVVWNWCMKEGYKPTNENVIVWSYQGTLEVELWK